MHADRRHCPHASIKSHGSSQLGVLVAALVACLAALVSPAATSTAHAGGGFLPPTRIDFGTIALDDGNGRTATGSALLVGMHWASLNPKRSSFDIGIGYVGAVVHDPSVRTIARGDAVTSNAELPSAHGAYLETSLLAHERGHLRSWASGRAEVLGSGGSTVLGLATRFSTELWSGMVIKGPSAAGVGVFAIGLWAELGVRGLPGGGATRHAAAGISIRIPALAASN